MTTTVGMVGLGVMGSAMSNNLMRDGFVVIGYDVNPERLRTHTEAGGIAAGSPAEVGEAVDTVILSLPSVAAAERVVSGERGLDTLSGRDLTIIETGTFPLDAKFWIRDVLSGNGMVVLDCPLSGTGAQAALKDLIVFVSGDEEAASRAAPVFEGFARRHYHVGEYGNGSKFKYVANLLVAIHNVSTAEALLLGRRAGLDMERMLEVIGDGAGASRMFQVRGPLMVQGTYDNASVRMEVFLKDVEIIRKFAHDLSSPTPLFATSAQLYEAAMAQGRVDQDAACVYAVLEQLTEKTAGES